MNLDASVDGHEAEYLVAIDGVTTLGELEVQTFEVLVDDQYIFLEGLVVGRWLDAVSFGTSVKHFVVSFRFFFLHFDKAVEDVVGIQLFVGDVLIEIGYCLVSQLFDEAHHYGFVVIHLSVLEFPFDGFLGKFRLSGFDFLQGLAYLGACLRSSDYVQPILLGCLCVRGHNLYLVAAVQLVSDLHVLAVHLRTDALASQLGVDAEREVEHRGSLGQLE